MKNYFSNSLIIFLTLFSFSSFAQVHNIKLEQTPGAFVVQNLTLSEGDYQFEIANVGVDHEVGFVLVPKGQYQPTDHIKAAYVKAPADTNQSSMTNVVSLKAGDYEYFCPLNPTRKYSLTVSAPESIKLTQVPKKFTTESLMIAEGTYQFEITNKDVGHDVGFVLVPKGKYDPADHIKTAYVKAPVASGQSGMTSVVNLSAGEYEYFCPLNPTAKYPLTVSNKVRNVKLTQLPGKFETSSLTLKPGQYQFEIANEGVGHQVGFVLVPKGKYDPADHIKAAYVKAPATTGNSSMTNVVTLEAGEYEYFCPLNPTAKNSLTVE